MSIAAIVIVIIIVVVLIALGVVFYLRHQRSERLKGDFGSEYERKVADAPNRGAAEKDLRQRQERHRALNIRPLDHAQRDGYRRSWDRLQAEFVDSPANAAREADTLVIAIMRKRGYPTDDFEQRAEDMSVEHPEVVAHYRDAHRVALAQQRGDAGTEELRKAAISYRALVGALLEDSSDKPQGKDRNGSTTSPNGGRAAQRPARSATTDRNQA